MIISVDHGNKSIKTPNALFTSGLIVSEGFQGFKTDYICWNNNVLYADRAAHRLSPR
jgi:plasmid segregation protein ParM